MRTTTDAFDRAQEGLASIDSRDVIEAIKDLTEERNEITEAAGARWDEARESEEHDSQCDCIACQWTRETYVADALRDEWSGDSAEILAKLEKLQEDAEGYSDWRHGATLIADHYFETYARDYSEDINGTDSKGWPFDYIDWEKAADALKMDYTMVTYGTTDYWVRS